MALLLQPHTDWNGLLAAASDGHGSKTSGKRSPYIEELHRVIRENEFNSPVVDFLTEELRNNGYKVLLVAPTDYDTPLKERTDAANEHDVDVYLSVHYNAFDGSFGGRDASGHSVHIYPGTRSTSTEDLAKKVANQLKKGTKQNWRGIKEDNFHELRETKMEAILTENGFMDNRREALLMLDVDFQKEVASEIARGTCNFHNVSYGDKPVRKPEPIGGQTYTIKSGDSLWEIAQRLKDASVHDLKEWNPDVDPEALQVGSVINITDPESDDKPVTTKSFLNSIEKGAINGWGEHGLLPSVTGAQAALESGWGKSSLAREANNLFGVKASTDWKGEKKSYPTKEQDEDGNVTAIDAYFRVYDTWSDSVEDHGNFFTSTDWRKKNYAPVIGEKDYKKQTKALQSCGYATDIHYADKLVGIIEANELYEWDKKILGDDYNLPKPDSKPSQPSGDMYTIQSGDTLSEIASEFGTTYQKLAAINNIDNPDNISVGQTIRVKSSGGGSSSIKTYTVKSGDTLSGIASKFNTSVNSLQKWNDIGNKNLIHPGDKLKVSGDEGSHSSGRKSYTIKSGDTLSGIASKFGTSINTLQKINGIDDPNMIHPGQKLSISSGGSHQSSKSYHTVKSGDTVSEIAAANNTTTAKIKQLNNLNNANLIQVGQRLRVK